MKERWISSWQSPSNIALVKYWGKKDGQLPANPSVSMTLSRARTITTVEAGWQEQGGILSVNGLPDHPFIPKLTRVWQRLSEERPATGKLSCRVVTENTFPHSAGIASSASGISAFTLCLAEIICTIEGRPAGDDLFFREASGYARTGSGSASRSLFGGFVLWGKQGMVADSSDEYSVSVNHLVHPALVHLGDAIIVVTGSPKEIPSSAGHLLMNKHPWAPCRILQAERNCLDILDALKQGDFIKLSAIAENEALSLHALLMSSEGGPVLFSPETLQVIGKVRKAAGEGLNLFFTLDAGPNIHLVYPMDEAGRVKDFITREILPEIEVEEVIYDSTGSGPSRTGEIASNITNE